MILSMIFKKFFYNMKWELLLKKIRIKTVKRKSREIKD